MQGEDEAGFSNMPPHQRKASNVYGAAGPPQKSPRLWKFAPARGAPAGATTVLPYEAVSCRQPGYCHAAYSYLCLPAQLILPLLAGKVRDMVSRQHHTC